MSDPTATRRDSTKDRAEPDATILLTGASGFIGGALAGCLADRYALRVLTREPQGIKTRPWAAAADIHQGDIEHPQSLAGACAGVDTIVHAAGFAHASGGGQRHMAINHQGTLNLLRAAIDAGVRQFLYLSSSKAAADPGTAGAYARSKRLAEQALLDAHGQGLIQVCCLRPAAVYGLGMKGSLQGWIKLLRKGLAPPLPPLRTRIAMIGLEDLCRAVSLALASERVWGGTYLLSDGRAYQIKEIETRLRRALGKEPARFHLPRPVFRLAALAGELAGYCPGIRIPFGRAGYNTLFLDDYAHDEAFGRDTGFQARQDFHQAIPGLLQVQERQH